MTLSSDRCYVRAIGAVRVLLWTLMTLGALAATPKALAQPGFCDPPPPDDVEPNNNKFEASLAPPGDPMNPFDRGGFLVPVGGSIVAVEGCTRGSFAFDSPDTGGQSRTQDFYFIRIAADPDALPGTIARYRLQIESIGFDNNAFRGDFMGQRQSESVVLGFDAVAQRSLGVEFGGIYPFVSAPTNVWYAPADRPHEFFYRVLIRPGASDLSIGTGQYRLVLFRDQPILPPLMNMDFAPGRITIDLQRQPTDSSADTRGDNTEIWVLDQFFRPIPGAVNDDSVIVGSGRCCLAGGVCQVLPLDECAARQGVWDASPTCAGDPDPFCNRAGVCCIGSCACTAILVRPGDCPSGRWLAGPSTSCVPGLCDQGLGGCCLPDTTDPDSAGRCVVVSRQECFEAGGVYRGDTLGCRADVCPAPSGVSVGTCLIGAGPGLVGTCSILTRESCELTAGGRYLGDGSVCGPVTLRSVIGACCRGDGSCVSTLAPDPRTPTDDPARCNGEFDTWRPGLACLPHPCPITQYAACCAGTTCTIVTEAECTSVLAGAWLPLVTCEPSPCEGGDARPDQPKSRLIRQLSPGTYYLAVADSDLSTFLPSAPDDQFRSGVVLDLPGAILSGQTGPRVTDPILRPDVLRSLTISDRLDRTDLLTGILRSNPYDVAFVEFTVGPLTGAPALVSSGVAIPDVLETDGTGIFIAEVTVTPGADPPSTGLFGELIDPGVPSVRIPLRDDGFPPDRCAGDNIVTGLVQVVDGAGPPGPLDIPYTVGDAQGRTGTGTIRITLLPGPPGNSRCETPTDVTVGTTFGDNQLATTDVVPLCLEFQNPVRGPCGPSSRDVWYRFTALTAGDYIFDLTASTKETLWLSLHTACDPLALSCSCVCDPAAIVFPQITRTLADGEVVLVRVACCGVTSTGGPFQLRIEPAASTAGSCCRTGGVCEIVPRASACAGAFALGGVCTPGICLTNTGACCLTDSTCVIRTAGDCAEAGGAFTLGAVCGAAPCPPAGACCTFDGACFNALQVNCVTPNIWIGGSVCSVGLCPPGGACCTGALCQVVIQTGCPAGSTWFSGAACEPTSPCEPAVACCGSNTECFVILRSLCATPLSPTTASTCTPNPCGTLGVCCRTQPGVAPLCSLETFFACTSRGASNPNPGVWTAGAACSPTACPDVGRCCRVDGTCALNEFQLSCESAGGTWTRAGAGVTCAPGACPPAGSCCLSTGSCSQRTQASCGRLGGVFTAGGVCSPNPCPTVAACCVRGVCSVRTTPDCVSVGGVPQSATACTPTLCPVFGACCVPSAPAVTCTFVAQADCTAPGARWVANTTCSSGPCARAGACCAGPTCVVVFEDQCTPSAAFNPFTACSPDPCGIVAACCVVGQPCTLTTRAACAGFWTAGVTACTPEPCDDPGRCCGVDTMTATATCVVLTRAECPPANFTDAGTCTPNDCPPAGSCCLTTGACAVSTQASCGVPRAWSTGVVCGPSTCTTIGTCCRLGVCTLRVVGECLIDPDSAWSAGGVCDPNPCPPPPPPGFCCVGTRCAIVLATECVPHPSSSAAGTQFVLSPTPTCNASGVLDTPCCYADYNKDGGVGVQDIFDYLVDYFAASPDTRIAGDGTTAPGLQDLFDFLGAFLGGCTPAPVNGRCCVGAVCTIVPQASCNATGGAGAVFTPSVSTCNAAGNFTTPCCIADYNKAGGLTIQDVFDFLNDFFVGSPLANVDGDGIAAPSVQDIFDFLTAYFNGGC